MPIQFLGGRGIKEEQVTSKEDKLIWSQTKLGFYLWVTKSMVSGRLHGRLLKILGLLLIVLMLSLSSNDF